MIQIGSNEKARRRIVATVYRRAERAAARYVREQHPTTWHAIVEHEHHAAGTVRNPVGRPRGSAA